MNFSFIKNWELAAKTKQATIEYREHAQYFHHHEAYTLQYRHGDRDIHISLYLQNEPDRGRGYLEHFTRVYVPFDNSLPLSLKVCRSSWLRQLSVIFRRSHHRRTALAFDKKFHLTGHPKEVLQRFFSDPDIIQPLLHFNDLYIEIIPGHQFDQFLVSSKQDVLVIQLNKILTTEEDITRLIDYTEYWSSLLPSVSKHDPAR